MRDHADEPGLVRRAVAGERAAFDDLVRTHLPRVYGLLFRMLGNHEDAEDLAQECFVRAWAALPGWRAETRFAAWIDRIAVHLARDHWRSRGRRGPTALLDEASAIAPRAESGELGRALRAAIERLPPRLRAAIVLRVLEERDYEDVARLTGVRPATARLHVQLARRRLVRWLSAWLPGGGAA